MNINSKDFRVRADKKVKLKKWPTLVEPYYQLKAQYQEILVEYTQKLSAKQNLLYASNQYSLLLIFQGMDADGKNACA
jgi:polyphosphate kinase 2 (PPK2 family)